jgi:hypothetical protein
MILSKQQSQEDNDILQWLNPVEYQSFHDDLVTKRQPGTGQWLIDSKEFQSWMAATKQTLLCYGIPGAGKTYLASSIIEHLYETYSEVSTIGIAYVYCNFRQEEMQKVDDVLTSLLKQLAQQQSTIPTAVRDLYSRYQARKTPPSRQDLLRVLQLVIVSFSKTLIVLDALDELSDNCRPHILSQIFKIQAKTDLNLFLTSRPYLDTGKEFKECISLKSLEILARDEDIHSYLAGRMSELRFQASEALQEELTKAIIGAVKGMYVSFQLFELVALLY